MTNFIQAVFLGIIQGLTEFLPVSSSGHLLLAQFFLGVDPRTFGLSFDVALHLGTLVAVISFFWRDLIRLIVAFLRSLTPQRNLSADPEQRLAYLLIVSTVPAAIIGALFQSTIESALRSPWVVVVALVVVGFLFIVAEAVGKKAAKADRLGFGQAFGIGVAQAAALIPGVSRSGATITLALFLGITREDAARFSFLMSIPIIGGAGLLSLGETLAAGLSPAQTSIFLVGFVTSAVVGYLAIRFFLRYVADHSLRAFAYYRFALAAVVALLLILFY